MAKIYPHMHFVGPRSELKRALENPERGRFICVIGPSGVGKTTVRRALLREICGNPAHWGAGRIPVIEVFALLAQNAYFSSRSLVESMVHELFVPDLRWLRDGDDVKNPMYLAVKAEVERAHTELNGMPLPKGTERSMWQHFQDLSGARGVWLTAIDQAHALCVNHRNTDPADHILNLMSILEKGEMNILLSGVHGAADLWVQRPEVRRRTTPIWMPPYSYERKQDRDPFLTLLRTLGQRYTFSKRTLLFEMASELMAASAGIFGVVRKILVDAEERARCAGRVAITKTDIADSYYGERDYEKMWEDVRFFEEVMKSASTKSKAVVVSRAWGLGNQSANRDKALNPVTTAT
ncbi:ATP-binding protein [Dyella sp.]|uniref:ATP-binding protein n=1 Tax=Dyella sp. TaxID=1869338 RepID=UPI002B466ACB|nr:ATP-binding protein [Dyella sp.]HKT26794.1 ATP-binding protein [Dyella sp.]